MAALDLESAIANVNVTLQGQTFPCPLCGLGLDVRSSKNQKPYFVCNACGVQIFIRGKAGITRLQEILARERLVTRKESDSGSSVTAFNRLEQFRLQRKELEAKQGLIFRDKDLDNAIQAVDNEIQRMQGVLSQMAQNSSKRG